MFLTFTAISMAREKEFGEEKARVAYPLESELRIVASCTVEKLRCFALAIPE